MNGMPQIPEINFQKLFCWFRYPFAFHESGEMRRKTATASTYLHIALTLLDPLSTLKRPIPRFINSWYTNVWYSRSHGKHSLFNIFSVQMCVHISHLMMERCSGKPIYSQASGVVQVSFIGFWHKTICWSASSARLCIYAVILLVNLGRSDVRHTFAFRIHRFFVSSNFRRRWLWSDLKNFRHSFLLVRAICNFNIRL